MESKEKTPSPQEQTPSRRNRWKWILSGAASVVVLLSVLILGTPRRYRVPEVISPKELATVQEVIRKLSSSLLDKNGKFVECAAVTLTPEEVNALLTHGLRTSQPRKIKKGKSTFTGRWTDGKLDFRVSQPIGFLAVNVNTKVVPELRDGKLSIHVNSFRVGWLPLPSFLVQMAVNRAVAELGRKPEFHAVIELFQSIRAKDGNLEVRFYPKNLNRLLVILLS